jgi:hypothetical protein
MFIDGLENESSLKGFEKKRRIDKSLLIFVLNMQEITHLN